MRCWRRSRADFLRVDPKSMRGYTLHKGQWQGGAAPPPPNAATYWVSLTQNGYGYIYIYIYIRQPLFERGDQALRLKVDSYLVS